MQQQDDDVPDLEKISQDQLDAMAKLHSRFLEGRIGGRRASLENTDLRGLSLKDQNLRQSHFSGCSMNHMDLSGANFKEAELYACDLSHSNLYKTIFTRADLRGARIENANLEGADLDSADLRKGGVSFTSEYPVNQSAVNFRGANLSGAKLNGSMASHADFSDAMMSGANMSGADLRGAQLVGANMSNVEIDGAQLTGANTSSAILTGVKTSLFEDAGVDLSSSITDENVGISVSELDEPLPKLLEYHRKWLESHGKTGKQLNLTDVDLRMLGSLKMEQLTAIKACHAKFFGMNLYKVAMQSAMLDESDFRNCDMEESDLRGSSFIGANLSHANLKKADCSALMLGAGGIKRFNPCIFEGAVLRYTKMEGGSYKNAIFKNADLSYADLNHCDLSGADFSGAIMHNTNLDDTITEGTTFDRDENNPVFRIPSDTNEKNDDDE